MKILGIDIGGSAVKGAPVDTKTGELLAKRHRIATPERLTPAELVAVVAELAAHFKWKGRIGCGFPGVVHHGRVRFVGNLHPDFVGCDVAAMFAAATGARVSVINDADAAGLAEIRLGAGRGRTGSVVMLTFGTGVGSGLFVDGQLYPNSEFGHLPMKGRSAEKYVAASVREKKDLSFKQWACRVNEYLKLVQGVAWPELVIIGGGISADHKKWARHIRAGMEVVPAALYNEAGIVGAALAAE